MILAKYSEDGNVVPVAKGRTVRYLLLQAAYHDAENMLLTCDDGEPLIRCIINGVMPGSLRWVLNE